MAEKYMQLVLTPAVQRAQDQYFGGHDSAYAPPETDPLTVREADFIGTRDSFYIATVSETGWPYMQHRGGPAGFVRILGPNLIGFADFRGNRQLITTGNLAEPGRMSIFMMDYPRRARLKMLGHGRVLDAREHLDLARTLTPEGLRANVERLFLIDVISYDWNCPNYITPRFSAEEMEKHTATLVARIAELEAQLARKSSGDLV